MNEGGSFWRNCGAALVGEYRKVIWYYQPRDNVNWSPLRFSKLTFRALTLRQSEWRRNISLWGRANARNVSFENFNGDQFTPSTQLIIPKYFKTEFAWHNWAQASLEVFFVYPKTLCSHGCGEECFVLPPRTNASERNVSFHQPVNISSHSAWRFNK